MRRALLFHFVEVLPGNRFKRKFSVLAIVVRNLSELVIKVNVPASRSVYKFMTKKAETRPRASEKDRLAKSPDQILKVFWSEQLRQIIRVSLFAEMNGMSTSECGSCFYKRLREGPDLVRIFNGGRYWQLILESTARIPNSTWTMINPSAFEVFIFLHGISLVHTSTIPKKLSCCRM